MDKNEEVPTSNQPPPYQLHNNWLTEEEQQDWQEEEEKRCVQIQAYQNRVPMHAPLPEASDKHLSEEDKTPAGTITDPQTKDQVAPSPLRRSKHDRVAPSRLTYEDKGSQANKILGGYLSVLAPPDSMDWFDPAYESSLCYDAVSNTIEDYIPGYDLNPWSLIAKKKNDPDLPRWEEAMCGPYKTKFIEGMEHEIKQLTKMDTWIEVDEASLPKDAQIVKTTWSFKIARLPDGTIKKFHSRFCVRGDTQSNVGEVYAPVVQWSTIRMCLSLANQQNLKTRAIDISNAFCTAPLDPEKDKDVYVEMPRGFDTKGNPFRKKGKVYKLKKSLYGMRNASRVYWNHLKKVLTDP